jgi:hypothetical protein
VIHAKDQGAAVLGEQKLESVIWKMRANGQVITFHFGNISAFCLLSSLPHLNRENFIARKHDK